ncbi:hypothetical protein ES702_01702 [subsurface metagenome]
MTIGRIKNELDDLKEKIDKQLPTRTIAIWLFSILSSLVDYLQEKEKKSGHSQAD